MAPQNSSWSNLLTALIEGRDLGLDEVSWAMDQIMSGSATSAQLAGFLVALRAKGETVTELRGLADMMLAHARSIEVSGDTLDIVGTGGDCAHTVNISSMSSIVCAAAGAKIVKHGNRASSSSSGSADVMERLGVRLDITPQDVVRVADQAGITFCFAQTFHPSMRHAAAARKELGVATAFNVLGPLTNPARPRYGAIGVADARLAPLVAGVFAARRDQTVVFRGTDGLDEVTLSGDSQVWWVHQGEVTEHRINPQDVGLELASIEALRGGEPEYNAQVVRDLLAGATGPVRDAVLINSGIALARVAAGNGARPFGEHDGLVSAVQAGVDAAARAIDSGAAAQTLQKWVDATNA